LPIEASGILISPDGRTLAAFPSQYPDGFRPGFPQPSPEEPLGAGQPREIQAASPATAQTTNEVRLWDLAAGSLRTNLVIETPQMQPGFVAAFSPDGRTLAIVSFDIIHLWDVMTGQIVGTCAGHKQVVRAVAFSPDGRTLASASDDSTLKLWNVTTQQELLTIRRLGGNMSELLFSPDGQVLVSAGGFPSQSEGLRFYRAPLFNERDRQR